jgi:signal transduction histidine kinase
MKPAAKHCLLVVDDEPDIVHSLQDLLRFDYRVLGATRAVEGLQIVQREQVHIVMTDQRMPEMTGVEFLRRLRETQPDTIRLLFTAYADIKAIADAINQGNVYRYITKPLDAQELQGVLRQAAEYYDLLAERKRLLAQLQEKNRELETANARLKEENELKKAFISVASHELRTPVTIVMGLSELAARTPGVAPPLADWLTRIRASSERLNTKIDQMIKLLLANQFERPLALQEVSLADLLRKAVVDVMPGVEVRRQKLELDIPDDLGTIKVEEDKIRDSVAHLLFNAVKFTPDGGTIRLAAQRLADGKAEIRVSDTGLGIEPSSKSRIFEPFFTRFDVSRHSSGVFEFDRRGLGLGLSLVKKFIEMHGGQVKVESDLGRGSTFTITLLPRPPEPPPPSDWHL